MSRSNAFLLGTPPALSLALGAVIGLTVARPSAIPVAHAISCPTNSTCSGENPNTMTSNIFVEHTYTNGGTTYAVMPDDGETWSITAKWRDARSGYNCALIEETGSVTVSWNGSSWVLSNSTTTGGILGFSLCAHGSGCSGSYLQPVFGYRLLVNIADPYGNGVLDTVYYETSSVDDGTQMLGGLTPCSNLGSSVSPTSQTFATTDAPINDWGDGRCPFNCNASNGPTVTLTYQ